MAKPQPDRFQLGRTIALTGVVLVIGLAIVSMMLLGLGLMPQIFPTLFPSTNSAIILPLTNTAKAEVMYLDTV